MICDEKTVDALSRRQKRLLEAVGNLPEPWPSNRPWRSDGERLSRHLMALRERLIQLEKSEEKHGDNQYHVHHNRAERNALIFVLSEYAERAGIEAYRAPKPAKPIDPTYIDDLDAAIDDAISTGFTIARKREPCVLYHGNADIAPIRVPLPVWFAVRVQSLAEDA